MLTKETILPFLTQSTMSTFGLGTQHYMVVHLVWQEVWGRMPTDALDVLHAWAAAYLEDNAASLWRWWPLFAAVAVVAGYLRATTACLKVKSTDALMYTTVLEYVVQKAGERRAMAEGSLAMEPLTECGVYADGSRVLATVGTCRAVHRPAHVVTSWFMWRWWMPVYASANVAEGTVCLYGCGPSAPARLGDMVLAMCEEARARFREKHRGQVVLYRPNLSEGGVGPLTKPWVVSDVLPARPASTICLNDGVYEYLLRDLEYFLQGRARYVADAMPYRRGYMLHGPPGTGKSTTILVLAGALGKHIAYVDAKALGNPKVAIDHLLNNVPPDTFVVFEDIDEMTALRSTHRQVDKKTSNEEEEEEKKKHGDFDAGVASVCTKMIANLATSAAHPHQVTELGINRFGEMLNALDGMTANPYPATGRVVFFTTNNPLELDPAMVRPGRIDVTYAFQYATELQVCSFIQQRFPTAARTDVFNFCRKLNMRTSWSPFTIAQLHSWLNRAQSTQLTDIDPYNFTRGIKSCPKVAINSNFRTNVAYECNGHSLMNYIYDINLVFARKLIFGGEGPIFSYQHRKSQLLPNMMSILNTGYEDKYILKLGSNNDSVWMCDNVVSFMFNRDLICSSDPDKCTFPDLSFDTMDDVHNALRDRAHDIHGGTIYTHHQRTQLEMLCLQESYSTFVVNTDQQRTYQFPDVHTSARFWLTGLYPHRPLHIITHIGDFRTKTISNMIEDDINDRNTNVSEVHMKVTLNKYMNPVRPQPGVASCTPTSNGNVPSDPWPIDAYLSLFGFDALLPFFHQRGIYSIQDWIHAISKYVDPVTLKIERTEYPFDIDTKTTFTHQPTTVFCEDLCNWAREQRITAFLSPYDSERSTIPFGYIADLARFLCSYKDHARAANYIVFSKCYVIPGISRKTIVELLHAMNPDPTRTDDRDAYATACELANPTLFVTAYQFRNGMRTPHPHVAPLQFMPPNTSIFGW